MGQEASKGAAESLTEDSDSSFEQWQPLKRNMHPVRSTRAVDPLEEDSDYLSEEWRAREASVGHRTSNGATNSLSEEFAASVKRRSPADEGVYQQASKRSADSLSKGSIPTTTEDWQPSTNRMHQPTSRRKAQSLSESSESVTKQCRPSKKAMIRPSSSSVSKFLFDDSEISTDDSGPQRGRVGLGHKTLKRTAESTIEESDCSIERPVSEKRAQDPHGAAAALTTSWDEFATARSRPMTNSRRKRIIPPPISLRWNWDRACARRRLLKSRAKPHDVVDGEQKAHETDGPFLKKLSPEIRTRYEANKSVSFLKLPAEIRILIYEHVFEFKTMRVAARDCASLERRSWSNEAWFRGDRKWRGPLADVPHLHTCHVLGAGYREKSLRRAEASSMPLSQSDLLGPPLELPLWHRSQTILSCHHRQMDHPKTLERVHPARLRGPALPIPHAHSPQLRSQPRTPPHLPPNPPRSSPSSHSSGRHSRFRTRECWLDRSLFHCLPPHPTAQCHPPHPAAQQVQGQVGRPVRPFHVSGGQQRPQRACEFWNVRVSLHPSSCRVEAACNVRANCTFPPSADGRKVVDVRVTTGGMQSDLNGYREEWEELIQESIGVRKSGKAAA